jgi:hypothetical protein
MELPTLSPAHLWRKSNRWITNGDEVRPASVIANISYSVFKTGSTVNFVLFLQMKRTLQMSLGDPLKAGEPSP